MVNCTPEYDEESQLVDCNIYKMNLIPKGFRKIVIKLTAKIV